MKILHLIDKLDSGDSARQLQLLGPALACDAGSVEICCLGPDTPAAVAIRSAGVPVHALQWTRWIDPGVLWNLREVLRQTAPDVIHVWRVPALRTLAVVARELLPRVVMTTALSKKGRLAWWDRWLLQQVRCVAVAGVSDQERCLHQGVTRPSLRVVPPAVSEPERQREPVAGARALTLACVGELERESGFRQAIWAFDIILHLFPEARLHLVGAGSQRHALQALSKGLRNEAQVHFLGERADPTAELRAAEIVWIPSLANCGRQTALEAMAQGRAVIASDVPCLREVILDGETGYLVPPGDVIQLARRTGLLLQDHTLRERLGQTARQSMQQRFPIADAVARWQEVYRSVAA